MHYQKIPKAGLILSALVLLSFTVSCFFSGHRVDYNSEIKPIFNKNCISCHGGVKRQSGFSLLFRSEAMAKNESGKPAIISGDPEPTSQLIKRLTLKDPEERMPYKHAPLSEKEITTLKTWIKQGAVWGGPGPIHQLSKRPYQIINADPSAYLATPSWINNDIDQFIYQKIKAAGMFPSDEADKAMLLRRVSLDLTGMPASVAHRPGSGSGAMLMTPLLLKVARSGLGCGSSWRRGTDVLAQAFAEPRLDALVVDTPPAPAPTCTRSRCTP